MNLNQYAYYQGYLVPPNQLPPAEKQKYQFWHPLMGSIPQNPDEVMDPALRFYLSQKYMPVRDMPAPSPLKLSHTGG